MKPGSRRLLRFAAAGAGATAAAVTTGLVVERRIVRTRRASATDADRLGGLHADPVEVLTDDGVALHAEVDEVAPYGGEPPKPRLFARRKQPPEPATLVFVHGYALNLDCWHFQRAYFRGKRRMVFYDQRSHGESGRSDNHHATIEQLGRDLKTVIDQLAPDGPVVLVGHSMGGMSIIALAELHPELFGDKVTGVALIATTAGGLKTHRILSPLLPGALAGQVTPRLMAGLARAPELVDSARRRGSNIGFLFTDRLAFGDEVPGSYVEFVDDMLSQTSFEVLAQFFPNFDGLDKFAVLSAFERVPTLILCGTKDLLTSIGHSRKMAARLPSATLVEAPGAGHMVILERKDQVNEALDGLLDQADEQEAVRAS
ncbi:MAG: alpha/beta fold hydrolase [Nocardioidaceae bacterium]